MKNNKNKCKAVLLILSVVIMGCCEEELFSTWRDRRVAIDGIDDRIEWDGALHKISKGDITVGLLNDEKNLYMCIFTRNPAVREQILSAGLTIWFDETGGREQIYGFHYPLPIKHEKPNI